MLTFVEFWLAFKAGVLVGAGCICVIFFYKFFNFLSWASWSKCNLSLRFCSSMISFFFYCYNSIFASANSVIFLFNSFSFASLIIWMRYFSCCISAKLCYFSDSIWSIYSFRLSCSIMCFFFSSASNYRYLINSSSNSFYFYSISLDLMVKFFIILVRVSFFFFSSSLCFLSSSCYFYRYFAIRRCSSSRLRLSASSAFFFSSSWCLRSYSF